MKALFKKVKDSMSFLLYPALILAAVICLLTAMGNVEAKDIEEEKLQLEESISRAVVNCYSIEGSYPATLSYVENHYGLQIDHKRFDVFYEVFADNIMPEITVIVK